MFLTIDLQSLFDIVGPTLANVPQVYYIYDAHVVCICGVLGNSYTCNTCVKHM